MITTRPTRLMHKCPENRSPFSFAVLTDLTQAELVAVDGGVARSAPDSLSIDAGATMEWDDGSWFLDFQSTNR